MNRFAVQLQQTLCSDDPNMKTLRIYNIKIGDEIAVFDSRDNRLIHNTHIMDKNQSTHKVFISSDTDTIHIRVRHPGMQNFAMGMALSNGSNECHVTRLVDTLYFDEDVQDDLCSEMLDLARYHNLLS
jgi:hypothetical protein